MSLESVEVVVRESEAAHDRCRMVTPAVAARVLKPGLRSRVGGEGVGPVIPGRHRGLEPPHLLLGRDEWGARWIASFREKQAAAAS